MSRDNGDSCMMEWVSQNAELIVAISAVVISIISLVVARNALHAQREHNILSVKPIAHFSRGDYEDCIFVKIKNYGLGPLLVDSFDVKKDQNNYKTIVDSLEGLASEITWDTFTDSIDGRVLAPNQEFVLLKVTFDKDRVDVINNIRKSLAKTTLSIKYNNIYDKTLPVKTEELKWFGG